MSATAERLAAIRERIDRAAAEAGRDPASITLVGISKRKPAAAVVQAVRAGLRHVGESYVQEALPKLAEVRAALEGEGRNPPTWHFVGRLQRNKAGPAAEAFDVIETLDRASLGAALERRAAGLGRTLTVLVQVDVSGEPQKGGVAPGGLPALLEASAGWPHLRVAGLMCIPAAGGGAAPFARLRELRDAARRESGLPLEELSMGMSGDFEMAIREGATMVRVGTAIFGPREGSR